MTLVCLAECGNADRCNFRLGMSRLGFCSNREGWLSAWGRCVENIARKCRGVMKVGTGWNEKIGGGELTGSRAGRWCGRSIKLAKTGSWEKFGG